MQSYLTKDKKGERCLIVAFHHVWHSD